MAMDKNSMGGKIITKLSAIHPEITSDPLYQATWIAVADAIIEEITLNMQVDTTVSITGVTPGPGVAGGTGISTAVS